MAGRYTLLDQAALPELLPICEQKRIAIIIGGVYNSGILANLDNPERATFNYRPAEQRWLDKARQIKAVCDRHGVPIQAAALQFPLAHPAVAVVLTGARIHRGAGPEPGVHAPADPVRPLGRAEVDRPPASRSPDPCLRFGTGLTE